MNIPKLFSSNALMDIMTYGQLNKEFEKQNKYEQHSYNNYITPINNGMVKLYRKSDLVNLKYLITNRKVRRIYFSADSIDNKLLVIPLEFFDKLLNKKSLIQIERKETYTEYTYDLTLIWNNVAEPIWALSDRPIPGTIPMSQTIIDYCFSFDNPDDLEGYMLFEGIFLREGNQSLRRKYINRKIETPIKHLYTQVIPISTKTNTTDYVTILCNFSLWNGFFIENLPVKNIKKIIVNLNGFPRIDYEDKKIIQLLCHKINDTLLYIPFNNKSWNYDDYKSSINFGRIYQVHLRVELDGDHKLTKNKFLVRGLVPNKISYIHGIDLKYAPGTGFPTLFKYYEQDDRFHRIRKILYRKLCCELTHIILDYSE